jgi:group I intron endonuclease
MTGYIYKMSWVDCPFYYIGQTINVKARMREHLTKLKRGAHGNKKIQSVYNRYGIPVFQIIEQCSVNALNAAEQKYLTEMKSDSNSCNIYFFASSANGYKWSEEKKRKHSQILKDRVSRGFKPPSLFGKDNPFYGRKHSEESITKMKKIKEGKRMGGENPKAIIVLNCETGIFYDCIKHASETTMYSAMYLVRMLSGDRKNKTSFIYA